MRPYPFFGPIASFRPMSETDLWVALARLDEPAYEQVMTIEIRLDWIYLYSKREDLLIRLAETHIAPRIGKKMFILTLRSKEQGGLEFISAHNQWAFWRNIPRQLGSLVVDPASGVFVDWDLALLEHARGKGDSNMPFPWDKIGGSWHDFLATPDDLDLKLRELEASPARAFLKIVPTIVREEDKALIKALFKGRADPRPLIAFGMSPLGTGTREDCLEWGSAGTFGFITGFGGTASGQLNILKLLESEKVRRALKAAARS